VEAKQAEKQGEDDNWDAEKQVLLHGCAWVRLGYSRLNQSRQGK
jgi:hypothetical protein